MRAIVCRILTFILGIPVLFIALAGHALAASVSAPALSSGTGLLTDKKATQKIAPYVATRYGPMAIHRFDLMQRVLFNKVSPSISNKKAADFTTDALTFAGNPPWLTSPTGDSEFPLPDATAQSKDWSFWLSGMSLPERYDAKSPYFTDVSGSSTGYSLGASRKFEDYTIGLTGFYLLSSLSGDGWSAQAENYGFLAGVRSSPVDLLLAKPWLEAGLGYAYSQAAQDRDDHFGNAHASAPSQHGLRFSAKGGQQVSLPGAVKLTPILGLDYTYSYQNQYEEDGSSTRLTVYSSKMHSARARTGGEVEMKLLGEVNVTSHAFFHYELGDKHASLDAAVVDTDLRFRTKGENYNRKSGNGSVGLAWQPTEDFSVKAQYDVTVGYHQPFYEMQAVLEWSF